MALTITLYGVAVLLMVSAFSLFLYSSPWGRILVYGVSFVVTAIGLVASAGALLAQSPAETLTLPIGLPWLGAHFRLDALSAFFLAVVNLGGAAASFYALGYG